MALPLPATLTPTKAAAFAECPFAFRRSVIERVATPTTVPLALGTITHAALERFYRLDPDVRTADALAHTVQVALDAAQSAGELASFLARLDEPERARLGERAHRLAGAIGAIEDPRAVVAIGTELRLEHRLEGVLLRGVIDRLDLEDDGSLVVVDYKTGRTPPPSLQDARLGGVLTYALLAAELLGHAPRLVRLVYLQDGCVIERSVDARLLRGVRARLEALWSAIVRACEREDFPARPSRLCAHCPHRSACPAMGAAA